MPSSRAHSRVRYLSLVILLAAGMLLICSPRFELKVRATGGYYDVMSNCDGTYSGTYYDCISSPYMTPVDQCRSQASSAYSSCTYNAGLTHEMPDFCDSARQEYYSHCLLTYGAEGWSPDPDAFSTCRATSGIDRCE